jgi:DNA-binding response OmpR family regulator
MRVLVVEDNDELATLVANGLTDAGFSVDRMGTAADAQEALRSTLYSAIVLDLGLPDTDGLVLLRELRQRHDPVPVLVLTARAGVRDRVEGLRSGADDYLVKPFAFEELVARLEALLRRPHGMLGTALSLANLSFDTASRQAFVDGEPRLLSARECAVLEILMRRKGHVVPKSMVEDQLFGLSGEVSSNAVEVYVHRLRRSLADQGAQIRIHTIRGVGYMIGEDRKPC